VAVRFTPRSLIALASSLCNAGRLAKYGGLSMTSSRVSDQKPRGFLSHLEQFLDRRVLPYPVKYLTNRIVILATLVLLVPLIFFTGDQPVVNTLNSYLNVMSVVVSSTVLLYATIADVRDRAAAQRREEIASEYQQVLEKRVEAEHVLNEKILELAAQNSIQGMQVERLEKIRTTDRKQAQVLAKEYEKVLENRVQAEHELNEKILAHAVENSLQNVLVENLEKLRNDDRDHAAELARAYEQVLEKRVQVQQEVVEERVRAQQQVVEDRVQEQQEMLEKRVQEEHELNEKILKSTIDNVLGERLKMVLAEEDTRAQQMHEEVIARLESYHVELAELAQLVQTLRPSLPIQPVETET
jgi:hypothetical protein